MQNPVLKVTAKAAEPVGPIGAHAKSAHAGARIERRREEDALELEEERRLIDEVMREGKDVFRELAKR